MGTLFIGILIGAIGGALTSGFIAGGNKASMCEGCQLQKAYMEAETKRREVERLAEREAFFNDMDVSLPKREPIKVRNRIPHFKNYK